MVFEEIKPQQFDFDLALGVVVIVGKEVGSDEGRHP